MRSTSPIKISAVSFSWPLGVKCHCRATTDAKSLMMAHASPYATRLPVVAHACAHLCARGAKSCRKTQSFCWFQCHAYVCRKVVPRLFLHLHGNAEILWRVPCHCRPRRRLQLYLACLIYQRSSLYVPHCRTYLPMLIRLRRHADYAERCGSSLRVAQRVRHSSIANSYRHYAKSSRDVCAECREVACLVS